MLIYTLGGGEKLQLFGFEVKIVAGNRCVRVDRQFFCSVFVGWQNGATGLDSWREFVGMSL
ncbi:MAG: hypothetical protein HQL77_13690 [Magnetococcales bacterium]|nr:hypothetical protein [Magnetococcales bacterium]